MASYSLSQPSEIGFFSLNGVNRVTGRMCLDRSQLHYYYPPERYPRVHFDLNQGASEGFENDQTIWERFEKQLTWIGSNPDTFRPQNVLPEDFNVTKNLGTDFVTSRGHLVKIMKSPYDNNYNWHMAVTRYNDVLYMSEVDRTEMPDQFFGYKFEHYLTSRDGNQPFHLEVQGVNGAESYSSVIQSELGPHRLLYSAEVDCRAGPGHTDFGKPSPDDYIELKTRFRPTTQQQETTFRENKLMSWWAQSVLGGVPTVVCGFRDSNLIVTEVETYRTVDIPGICHGLWDPDRCLNYCGEALQLIKTTVTENDPNVVYIFDFDADLRRITYRIKRDSEYSFIPPWFIEGRRPPKLHENF